MIDDGSAVPPIVIDDAFAAFTGFVTDDTTGFAGATVSFTAVTAVEAAEPFPAKSVATAVAEIVPSASPASDCPLNDHAPAPSAVVGRTTSAVPSVTSTDTVEFG